MVSYTCMFRAQIALAASHIVTVGANIAEVAPAQTTQTQTTDDRQPLKGQQVILIYIPNLQVMVILSEIPSGIKHRNIKKVSRRISG